MFSNLLDRPPCTLLPGAEPAWRTVWDVEVQGTALVLLPDRF